MNTSNHDHEPDRRSQCRECYLLATNLTPEEQAERIAQLAAEWADRVAKASVEETDRLAAEAFA